MSPDTATMLDDIAACGLPVIPVDLTFPTIDPAAPTSARAVVVSLPYRVGKAWVRDAFLGRIDLRPGLAAKIEGWL